MGRKAAALSKGSVVPIQETFEAAQRSSVTHARGVEQLQILRASVGAEAFHTQFINMINFLLPVFKREPAVERCVEFVVRFCTSADARDAEAATKAAAADEVDYESITDATLNVVIAHLLTVCGAKDKAVRFRACQLISRIFNGLDEEAEVDGDVCDGVLSRMLTRVTDKVPVVRVQAINALARLQDPTDAGCEIIAAYMARMASDNSPEVRRAALHQIAVSKKTLPAIVARTRDTKEAIRRHAYRMIGDKVEVTALTIAQRMQLLECGLFDRTAAVKSACADMLCNSWLVSLGQDPIRLLRCLDLGGETDATTCEQAIAAVLMRTGPTAKQARDFAALDPETALFWKAACAHARSNSVDKTTALETLLPGTTEYAAQVRDYAERAISAHNNTGQDKTVSEETVTGFDNAFIALQLLEIAAWADYGDEVGRRTMTAVARDLLGAEGLPAAFVTPLVRLVALLHPDHSDRLRLVAEVVADLREPLQCGPPGAAKQESRARELKMAALRVQLMTMQDKKEAAVAAEDYAAADAAKCELAKLEAEKDALVQANTRAAEPVRVRRDDPATWLACLTIVRELLASTRLPLTSPTMGTLVAGLIVPGVQHADPTVRNAAVRALGLCALLNRDFARTHILLFLQVVQVDQEVLQQSALEVLFDLVLVHGADTFAPEGEEEKKNDGEEETAEMDAPSSDSNLVNGRGPSVLTVLEKYLHCENGDLRTIAVEGFARLLLLDHLASPQIFAHLVLLFFNPTTEEDTRLRQCLSVFFPAFAFSRRAHQEVIESSFFPTLRTVLSAPRTSPLYAVKPFDVAEFLVCMTGKDASAQAASTLGVHESLALSMANEILSSPRGESMRCLCRCLNLLHIAGLSTVGIKQLRVLTEQMSKAVRDRAANKNVLKFAEKLAALDATPSEGLSDDQLEALRAATLRHMEEKGDEPSARDEDEEYGVMEPVSRSQRTMRTRKVRKPAIVDASSSSSSSEQESEVVEKEEEEQTEAVPEPMREQEQEQEKDAAASKDKSIEEEEEEEYEVEALVEMRKRGRWRQFLVKWAGYPDSENTWEKESGLPKKMVAAFDATAAAKEAVKENAPQQTKKQQPKLSTTRGDGKGTKSKPKRTSAAAAAAVAAAAAAAAAGPVDLSEDELLLNDTEENVAARAPVKTHTPTPPVSERALREIDPLLD